MDAKVFKYLILAIVFIYLLFLYFVYKYNKNNNSEFYVGENRLRNNLNRTYNGIKRFVLRLNLLWPMHLFFVLLLTLILILNTKLNNFNIENYLVTYISLIFTVYFIDFLNSEQNRRDTANKRFTIDQEFRSLLRDFEFNIHKLLYYNLPDENGFYNSERIFFLNETKIEDLISSEKFWYEDINLVDQKGYDYEITKKGFLNEVLNEKRDEVNLFLIKYSGLILYEDFKLIHELNDALNDFYLKKGANFPLMNQEMVALSIEGLINTIYRCYFVYEKWNN